MSNPLVSVAVVVRPPEVRNGNDAVAGAASEAFARWMHRRYVPVELPLAARYLVFTLRCDGRTELLYQNRSLCSCATLTCDGT